MTKVKIKGKNIPKKKLVFIVIILFIIVLITSGFFLYKHYQVKNAVIKVTLKKTLETEFLSEVKVSDFIESINGDIIDDYLINTKTIGKKEIKFNYINEDKIKVNYIFDIDIIDNTPPLVWLGSSYTVYVGNEIDFTKKVLCGDNYDNKPTCEVIGDYDFNTVGTYPLVFKATDNSGNTTEKNFNLNVINKTNNNNQGNNNQVINKTQFSDIVASHKNEKTEIGIDLSEWQGTIDFDKLKKAGVEFVILRVGGTKGIKGDYFLDGKFTENIEKANAIGMPVGIYFYSYANSKEKALKDAEWILKQIKPYKIDLPIAFDWENWSFYNEFNLSFFGLTDMANNFLDFFEENGYKGMLYSSKSYLESIWLETKYPIWLAHYAKSTSYQGDYEYWQLCNNGRVDGVNGDVDINIRYKE